MAQGFYAAIWDTRIPYQSAWFESQLLHTSVQLLTSSASGKAAVDGPRPRLGP